MLRNQSPECLSHVGGNPSISLNAASGSIGFESNSLSVRKTCIVTGGPLIRSTVSRSQRYSPSRILARAEHCGQFVVLPANDMLSAPGPESKLGTPKASPQDGHRAGKFFMHNRVRVNGPTFGGYSRRRRGVKRGGKISEIPGSPGNSRGWFRNFGMPIDANHSNLFAVWETLSRISEIVGYTNVQNIRDKK